MLKLKKHILLKMVESIKLNILDCSFQRKLKPIQNISLIIFTVSWFFIFGLLFFNSRWAAILFYGFIVLSSISIATSIITSLFFFKKKQIGILEISKEKIIINNKSIYNTKDCYFDLNIDSFEKQEIYNESIKKLPFWGNFLIQEKDNIKIEFEPNTNFEKVVPYIKIKNTKRSVLSMKTTDLFNNLMSLLWAAS